MPNPNEDGRFVTRLSIGQSITDPVTIHPQANLVQPQFAGGSSGQRSTTSYEIRPAKTDRQNSRRSTAPRCSHATVPLRVLPVRANGANRFYPHLLTICEKSRHLSSNSLDGELLNDSFPRCLSE